MGGYQIGTVESRFAEIIWENEPLSSTALMKLCAKVLCWKKSTTYTVLKRLCEKGIFQNEGGMVRALVSREDFYALCSERFVEETFDGSLPAFLTAFTKRKNLTFEEVAKLRQMVNAYDEAERLQEPLPARDFDDGEGNV